MQGNPFFGSPLQNYTEHGIPQAEVQSYLDLINQLQGMSPTGRTVGGGTTENDEYYAPSAQEEALLNQITGMSNQWLEQYPSVRAAADRNDTWLNTAAPYLFAGGALGAIGAAGGAAAGAGEVAAGGTAAGGSAPYIGAGGSAAAGATPGLLGETALTAGGIGGAGTGMVAGATGGGYPMPPPQSPPTGAGGAAGGIFGGVGDFLQNYGSIIGPAIGGGLGYLGQTQQTDALRDIANQHFAIGAPFRSTLEESYQPGFNLMDQPGYGDALQRTADISAKSANAQYGNPWDMSAQGQVMSDVWNQSYLPALSNYRGQLGQFGGLGLNTSGAAGIAGASTAGSQYAPIAGAFGQMFKQDDPYEDLARAMAQRYRLT